jgi:hypothetical protein
MSEGQADTYAASVRRTWRIMIALAMAGALVAGFLRGPLSALGFIIGAAISFVSFLRWHRIVSALGQGGRTRRSTILLALWPVVIAAILYVILKYSGINLMAVLWGLFVSAAAVSMEAVYQHYAGT